MYVPQMMKIPFQNGKKNSVKFVYYNPKIFVLYTHICNVHVSKHLYSRIEFE